MYAVVEIGGHQYKVTPGDIIDVQKLASDEGQTLEFDQVLFTGGEAPQVGLPTVKGAKVTAKIIRQARSRKVIVSKRSPGKYKRKNGHRQYYTGLLITEVNDGNGKSVTIAADDKGQKYLK